MRSTFPLPLITWHMLSPVCSAGVEGCVDLATSGTRAEILRCLLKLRRLVEERRSAVLELQLEEELGER